MAWTREKIDEVYLKTQQMSAMDEEFREELLKNPNEAIDPNYSATFVLPPMISEELDEGALENVAGGSCLNDGCIGDVCAAKAIITK